VRGAGGSYKFRFLAFLAVGFATVSEVVVYAQSCDSLFSASGDARFGSSVGPQNPGKTDDADVRIRQFQNRWKVNPEFEIGLHAMSRWAPRSELFDIAESLLRQRNYRRHSPSDQLQILFLLLQLQSRSNLATDEGLRRLFLNTLRPFTSGRLRLSIDRSVLLAYWLGEVVALNPGVEFDVTKPIVPSDPKFELLSRSLAALAHEVSHALSQPAVVGRISYLIEEYRAHQVGFIAENEYWPSKAQSASALLEVLFNPWRQEAYESLSEVFLRRWRTEPYRRLFELLSLDIEKVALELRSFRTPEFVARNTALPDSEIAKMRAIIQERLIPAQAHREPAPKFGWRGFTQNAPKTRRRED
jgi:hypothetical protein